MRLIELKSHLGMYYYVLLTCAKSQGFICLFGVLRRFQHCTGRITTGSWKGRGNQYIQFVRVLYCKLPTNGKQLPAFPLEAVPEIEPRPQTCQGFKYRFNQCMRTKDTHPSDLFKHFSHIFPCNFEIV